MSKNASIIAIVLLLILLIVLLLSEICWPAAGFGLFGGLAG